MEKNPKDNEGRTPLHLASEMDHLEIYLYYLTLMMNKSRFRLHFQPYFFIFNTAVAKLPETGLKLRYMS